MAINLFGLSSWKILFPVLLLILPFIAERGINPVEFLRPTRQGLVTFCSVSAITISLYPPLFLLYNTIILNKSFVIPSIWAPLKHIGPKMPVILLMALAEEIFFRAYIQETTLKRMKEKRFIITRKNLFTSIIFGAVHAVAFLNPVRAATFFPSLLFGWMAERSGGRIFYPVLYHLVCNLLAYTLPYFLG